MSVDNAEIIKMGESLNNSEKHMRKHGMNLIKKSAIAKSFPENIRSPMKIS